MLPLFLKPSEKIVLCTSILEPEPTFKTCTCESLSLMYLKENTCGKGFSPWFEFEVCNKFTYHGSIQFVPFRSLLVVNPFNKYAHFTLTIGP